MSPVLFLLSEEFPSVDGWWALMCEVFFISLILLSIIFGIWVDAQLLCFTIIPFVYFLMPANLPQLIILSLSITNPQKLITVKHENFVFLSITTNLQKYIFAFLATSLWLFHWTEWLIGPFVSSSYDDFIRLDTSPLTSLLHSALHFIHATQLQSDLQLCLRLPSTLGCVEGHPYFISMLYM